MDLGVSLPAEKGDRRRVFLGALTLQLANPKALLFFLALLPQFIDPTRAVVPEDVYLGGDVDVAGVLHSGELRMACAPRAACVRQVRHVAQHEPLARMDRGRGFARLRDPGVEIQSSRLERMIMKFVRLLGATLACAIVLGESGSARGNLKGWCIDSCKSKLPPTPRWLHPWKATRRPAGFIRRFET